MNKRVLQSVLLAILLLASVFSAGAQDDPVAKALVDVVAGTPEFSEWLAGYPGWVGNAYGPDNNNVWYVEFKSADDSEWLGYANFDTDTNTIQDSFIPAPLPPDVYQEQQQRVRALMLADPEVLARLGDPVLWDLYMDYNRYEVTWDAYFYRGIDGLLVRSSLDENNYFTITSIGDPNELSEEQLNDYYRSQAISLAYGAEGIDRALEGYDDWTTYVEPQGESRWSVSFVAGDQELFFALVDAQRNLVLTSQVIGE